MTTEELKQSYLTETNLQTYLELLFPNEEIVRDKKVPNSNILNRPDFRIEKIKLIVEFDGYGHYTNINTILNDIKKDEVYNSMGYDIIRIPYFIQMTSSIIHFLFSKFYDDSITYDFLKSISSEYWHGFQDKKVVYPSSFCSLGLEKYDKDFKYFSNCIDKLYKYMYEELLCRSLAEDEPYKYISLDLLYEFFTKKEKSFNIHVTEDKNPKIYKALK